MNVGVCTKLMLSENVGREGITSTLSLDYVYRKRVEFAKKATEGLNPKTHSCREDSGLFLIGQIANKVTRVNKLITTWPYT